MLSPLLFVLFIDPLLQKYEEAGVKALAFADDIAFAADGQMELFKAIDITKSWLKDHELSINEDKSGIIQVRADRRTPLPSYTHLKEIPIVDKYTYLGVQVDDCGDMKSQTLVLKGKLVNFQRQITMQWASKLPAKTRFNAWSSLIHSQILYATACLSFFSDKPASEYKTFLYRSCKGLLGIRGNPQ